MLYPMGASQNETLTNRTHSFLFSIRTCGFNIFLICLIHTFFQIVLRSRPKMSTFSQVYKPYARGRGVTPDVRVSIYNKC